MLDKLPEIGPEMKQAITGIAGLVPAALLARLLWHWRLVQLGHRRFWSRELFWEVPTAVLMGLMAGGLVSYFELGAPEGFAIAGVCGWLGPRGMEVLLIRLVERHRPKR